MTVQKYDSYYFRVSGDDDTHEVNLEFPEYGYLSVTFESDDKRRALGLRPAPTITVESPQNPEIIFSPTDLIIRDELGNLYEVVPRRKTKFNDTTTT